MVSRCTSAERIFTEGERVQLTAPWEIKGIANRETGTLERLDEKGNVILKLDKENKRVRFNLNEMKHLDYGYAVTSFSSQGTTVRKGAHQRCHRGLPRSQTHRSTLRLCRRFTGRTGCSNFHR